jgi:predicted anti-sigma-YlaC factor YlaD
MLFRGHVTRDLSEYHHGELTPAESVRIETHLKSCSRCRTDYEEIKLGARLASTLQTQTAPEPTWDTLKAIRPPTARRKSIPVFLAAGAAAAIMIVAILMRSRAPSGPSWEVIGPAGTSRLHPGDVLQTNNSSQAQVKIANIGQLIVSPNTRIRLLVTKPNEHRIALDLGRVEAQTWAPPRLFIVDTPSATAVDLGCRYSLQVQDDGSDLLHVTLGLVALDGEKAGYETIVPAGAFCRTRQGAGPGTPFFEDSSADFQTALQKVDSLPEGPERTGQLEVVLRESHIRDGLSLWHLLPRIDPQSRGLIYDRLAKLLPPPKDVTRDGIVTLDPQMLESWKKVVSQLWQ